MFDKDFLDTQYLYKLLVYLSEMQDWLFFHRMSHARLVILSQNPYLVTKYLYNLGSLSLFYCIFTIFGRFRPIDIFVNHIIFSNIYFKFCYSI